MKAAAAALAVVVLVAVVLVVREQTMSRHDTDPGSGTLEVVFELEENQATATRLQAAEALVRTCALEVGGSFVPGSLAAVDAGDRLRAQIAPMLDETDRAQLHGCLEDMWIDHVEADVVTLRRVADA